MSEKYKPAASWLEEENQRDDEKIYRRAQEARNDDRYDD